MKTKMLIVALVFSTAAPAFAYAAGAQDRSEMSRARAQYQSTRAPHVPGMRAPSPTIDEPFVSAPGAYRNFLDFGIGSQS